MAKSRRIKKALKAWEVIANDISRSADSIVRGKLDVEDDQEMILEGLDSFDPGKERTAWLKANVPEFATLSDKSRTRASEFRALQDENEQLLITIEFIRKILLGKNGNVDKLREFQASALQDAPSLINAAQEQLLQAMIFEKGSQGLGVVLDKGVESLARKLVLTSKIEIEEE